MASVDRLSFSFGLCSSPNGINPFFGGFDCCAMLDQWARIVHTKLATVPGLFVDGHSLRLSNMLSRHPTKFRDPRLDEFAIGILVMNLFDGRIDAH